MTAGRRDIPLEAPPADYEAIVKRHPWIIAKGQLAVLSPDSDGLLCALFLCHHLDWKIVGFYDGKVLLLQKMLSAKDCVFLDMEIFRKDIRSIGQHMLLYNKNDRPASWNRFDERVQPNNLRSYDALHDFPSKYPFATIHLLLGIVSPRITVSLSDSAFAPLFSPMVPGEICCAIQRTA